MKYLLLYFLFFAQITLAQQWTASEMAPMPKRVSNNAVVEGIVAGIPYVYSFGGIDSTKIYSGIHLNSYRYNTLTDIWEQIPDLPDTLGKIAISASNVKNKIYIIGGYHVYASGNEASSNKVHVYDPASNTFLANAPNIPVPIDDQVQCVWRDSLIYVITGWSNSTNVPNVQIFNPSANSWAIGTPVPNNSTYKVFGGAGVIIRDTIFYYGGASTGFNFPAQNKLRMGIINPSNPTSISWTSPSVYQNNYRSAATSDSLGNVYFLGGSAVSYNYNGVAYNGSGGVHPNTNYSYFNSTSSTIWNSLSATLPMDLRGLANINATVKYIVGGMEQSQTVSNKTLKLELSYNLGTTVLDTPDADIFIFPNPSTGQFTVVFPTDNTEIIISDIFGKIISKTIENQGKINLNLDKNGIYLVSIKTAKGTKTQKLIINQ